MVKMVILGLWVKLVQWLVCLLCLPYDLREWCMMRFIGLKVNY